MEIFPVCSRFQMHCIMFRIKPRDECIRRQRIASFWTLWTLLR